MTRQALILIALAALAFLALLAFRPSDQPHPCPNGMPICEVKP